jgi:rubrerythrin
MRADALYPEYQACIENYPVKISVRTIINEEEGHLEEMLDALSKFERETEPLMKKAVYLEGALFGQWVQAIHNTLPESV